MVLEHQSKSYFHRVIMLLNILNLDCFYLRYPAEVWGRQRNYWRAHFDVNFEKVLEIAREQLIKL